MQQETPPSLRRIKYTRVIRIGILICFILIGISAMQQHNNETTTEKISEKTAKKEVEKVDVTETVELTAGVGKKMLQLSKEPQVKKLDVDTVTSPTDTEPEMEIIYKTLEEVSISRDMDLTETTGLSREDFCELLANFEYDYEGFYERNAGLIWDLSQEYQVNEIFICGVFALESYYGSSDKHISAHNYGSIMTGNGKLQKFENDAEGIEVNFKLFAECYLSPEGKYYKGVTLDSIGDTYCPPTKDCPSWAGKVYSCMQKFLEEE